MVSIRRGSDESFDDLAELSELLLTAEATVVGKLVQQRQEPHPNLYLGPGKVEELKALLKESNAKLVVCDDPITPRQERNLERALGMPVIDRPALILDIFASHAHTAEGKLQVELAQLEYNFARMRGLWTHLERLGGGIGTRGPGETQIETDRRLARNRISQLKRRLEKVKNSRDLMRKERERAQLPQIALAGYTNAGKSSLLNVLCGADVEARDRLFQTLDPTTRTLKGGGRSYLLTDTVGFIRKLPHQLVEAFQATLEETQRADLILHVADASQSASELAERIAAVEGVLQEIGAEEIPQVLVLNKVDLLDRGQITDLRFTYPKAELVSAVRSEGLERLLDRIDTELRNHFEAVELLVPYSEGAKLAQLHKLAGEMEREETADGVLVKARLPVATVARFKQFLVDRKAAA